MNKSSLEEVIKINVKDFESIVSYLENMTVMKNVKPDFLFKMFRYKRPEHERLYNEVLRKIASYNVVNLETPVTEKEFYKEVKLLSMNKLLFDVIYRFNNMLRDKVSKMIYGIVQDAEYVKEEEGVYWYRVKYRRITNGKSKPKE